MCSVKRYCTFGILKHFSIIRFPFGNREMWQTFTLISEAGGGGVELGQVKYLRLEILNYAKICKS